MTRALSDAELVRENEHHWLRQGWTAEQVDAARTLAVQDRPPEVAAGDDVAVLAREMTAYLARGRAQRERRAAEISAENGVTVKRCADAEDLGLEP